MSGSTSSDKQPADAASVRVFVRVRPLNTREISRDSAICLYVDASETTITLEKRHTISAPSSATSATAPLSPHHARSTPMVEDDGGVKRFSFDRCFEPPKADDQAPVGADQQIVFDVVAQPLLEHALQGFNVCIFAYGQTGSGKSYTMMGYNQSKGIIPMACEWLFRHMPAGSVAYKVQVSYLEIYCEKARDLLNPSNKGNLRVREHPSLGPYVEDLSKLIVTSFAEISNLIDEGNKSRTVASTNMNETSSRSHAVFQLIITQTNADAATEKVSRISFVDLAGSERALSTGATGQRLKEGANINKSLTTLGKVISALADQSGKRRRDAFVPYRDSVLTWLLKDCLGGNSKTTMISCVSPSHINYDETLSTLRYSDRAKHIVNNAVINEDPNDRLVRALRDEINALKERLSATSPSTEAGHAAPSKEQSEAVMALKDQLLANEKLMSELNETWEEQLKRTQLIAAERERVLEELGISLDKDNSVGVYGPKNTPHLVNLNEDQLMSECLLYNIRPGTVAVGSRTDGTSDHMRICLHGRNIMEEHALLVNENNTVVLKPINDSLTFVNGHRIYRETQLFTLDRVRFGEHHLYRFVHPGQARRTRPDVRTSNGANNRVSIMSTLSNTSNVSSASSASDLSNGDQHPSSMSMLAIDHRRMGSPSPSHSPSGGAIPELDDWRDLASFRSVTPPSFAYQDLDSSDMQDPLIEQRMQLEQQLQATRDEYERKLKLISSLVSPTHAPQTRLITSAPLTPREIHLAKMAADRWKARISLNEILRTLLMLTPSVKRANVLANESGRKINYQWAVVDPQQFRPVTSLWENPSLGYTGLPPAEDFDRFPKSAHPLSLAVRVYDHEQNASFVWSYSEFDRRLDKMQQLLSPNSLQAPTFVSPGTPTGEGDAFTDHTCSWFERIGNVYLPLHCIHAQQPGKYRLPVIGAHARAVQGHLRVNVRPLQSGEQQQHQQGQLVDIMILELDGISEEHYTQIHVQFDSAPLNAASPILYSTEPVSDFGTSPVPFLHSQVVTVSADVSLHSLSLQLEVLGRRNIPTDVLMQREIRQHVYEKPLSAEPERGRPLVSTDDLTERARSRSPISGQSGDSGTLQLPLHTSHIVTLLMEVSEIEANGTYAPVPVSQKRHPQLEMPTFFLRQGLQRRVYITLRHHSAYEFAWKGVRDIRFSTPRLVDANGKVLDELSAELPLRLLPSQSVLIDSAGRGFIEVQGQWDSSLFEYVHLDRTTPASLRVLLDVSLVLDVAQCKHPITLTFPFAVVVANRDQKRGRRVLGGIFNGGKLATRSVSLFDVLLTLNAPQRLPTQTYVRGEEFLDRFHVLGLPVEGASLVTEALTYQRWHARLKEVNEQHRHQTSLPSSPTAEQSLAVEEAELTPYETALSYRILELWQEKPAQNTLEAFQILSADDRQKELLDDQPSKHRSSLYLAQTTPLALTSAATRSGYLLTPENDDDQWVKRWFVLRRPYLLIYENANELEERAILPLSQARFSFDPHLSQVLNKPFAFAVYTRHYGYLLQASSQVDMVDWMGALDPLLVSALHSRRQSLQPPPIKTPGNRTSVLNLKSLFKFG
ncbi:hypothetical protein RI367_007825 [Sorochytrium milnesiophthora]